MAEFHKKPFRNWLDALARLVVKERDGWACCKCGRPVQGQNCHWAHVIGRTPNRTRWEPLNALCLCSECHGFFDLHPVDFGIWFNAKYPARKLYQDWIDGMPLKTWREDDYKRIEAFLLRKCRDLYVDPYKIEEKYRKRLVNKLKR